MYNSVGSTFFSPEELLTYVFFAETELANKAYVLQQTYTTNTVIAVRDYPFPTTTLSVKKATWNGVALKLINLTEDDLITGFHEDTTSQGQPRFYSLWNNTISLRPIPNDVQALKIWAFNKPILQGPAGVFSTPDQYHYGLTYYVLACMTRKDERFELADTYDLKWDTFVEEVTRDVQKQKRADAFAQVKDDELLQNFFILARR